MKKTTLLLFAFACLLHTCAQAKDKYKKYRYNPKKNRRYDDFLFAGVRADLMLHAVPIGNELIYSTSFIRRLYFGFNLGADDGVTSDTYGYNQPNVKNYHLQVYTGGFNLQYVLHHSEHFDCSVHFLGALEELRLCSYSSSSFLNPDGYHTIAYNDFWSLRPMVTMEFKRFAIAGAYNFLLQDVNFGQTTAAYGNITDFEGPQISAWFAIKDAHRHQW